MGMQAGTGLGCRCMKGVEHGSGSASVQYSESGVQVISSPWDARLLRGLTAIEGEVPERGCESEGIRGEILCCISRVLKGTPGDARGRSPGRVNPGCWESWGEAEIGEVVGQ